MSSADVTEKRIHTIALGDVAINLDHIAQVKRVSDRVIELTLSTGFKLNNEFSGTDGVKTANAMEDAIYSVWGLQPRQRI